MRSVRDRCAKVGREDEELALGVRLRGHSIVLSRADVRQHSAEVYLKTETALGLALRNR